MRIATHGTEKSIKIRSHECMFPVRLLVSAMFHSLRAAMSPVPFCIGALLALTSLTALADRPRAWQGKVPDDARLDSLKDLNGYFPFNPPSSRREWEARAEAVRRRVLVSQGLWPLPKRTPLQPVIHSRLERDGYTMESAFFEAAPGFHVTGTLYRPQQSDGKAPGILCPHGHWPNGRFMDRGVAGAQRELEMKAESLLPAARSPLQARCVQLARMGCVVFHYDMIGYADSQQISYELAHRFAKQRPEWNDPQDWGLFSPQAESRFQSVMGLQTWSSMRAVDFISSLPDVDPQRIAVTGASGGGTQTFMLGAVDSRIAAAVPAVMVSTAMQGGCTCENASGLRVGVGNVEFAALFAPKPLGLTAADDWTKEMASKGFPQLQELYALLDAEENVALWSNVQFPHNFNAVSREEMYRWFNRHLQLGLDEPLVDRDFPFATQAELAVYRNGHQRPPGGPELERQVIRWWTSDSQQQLQSQLNAGLDDWRAVAGPALDTVIGRELPEVSELKYDQTGKVVHDDYVEMVGDLSDVKRGEHSPVLFLYPKQWDGHVVIWLGERGKDDLLDESGKPQTPVAKLLAAGVAVAGIDLLGQGEFLQGKPAPTKTRKVGNPREAAAYTFGYNHSLFARRVHDVLKMVAFVLGHEYQPKQVSLVGWRGRAGIWAAAARAQTRDIVANAVVHTRGFRFADVNDIHSPAFLPGGAKYGDVPGMLAVAAPAKLWVADEGLAASELGKAIADSVVSADRRQTDEQQLNAALDWLISQR